MLIKYHALTSLLSKKQYPIYVLTGAESFLLNEAALQIKQSLTQQGEFSLKIIDIDTISDWSMLFGEANSYSLFYENVVIDARFEKKTIDAKAKELFSTYLANVNSRCTIILRAPSLATQKSLWLHNNPNTLTVQIYPLTDVAHKQWIETQCKLRKLNTSKNIIDLIFHCTQGNLLASAQCIEKLAVALPESELITEATLQEYLSDERHYEIHELAVACLQANTNKALHLLQQSQLDQTEPTLLLWIISQEIRQLIKLKSLINTQGISAATACERLSIWTSRVSLYSSAIQRLTLPHLHTLLQQCKQIDAWIKTSATHMFWDQLDRVILGLTEVYTKR